MLSARAFEQQKGARGGSAWSLNDDCLHDLHRQAAPVESAATSTATKASEHKNHAGAIGTALFHRRELGDASDPALRNQGAGLLQHQYSWNATVSAPPGRSLASRTG